jgi:hypothetical protein
MHMHTTVCFVFSPQIGNKTCSRGFHEYRIFMIMRGVAQLGSASALGAEGRRFKSCHPDSKILLPL